MSVRILTLLVFFSGAIWELQAAILDPSLSAHYISNDKANVMVVMKGNVAEVISAINSRSFKDSHEKTIELRRELESFTKKSQSNVLSFLKRRREPENDDMIVKSFYITNRISIRNAPKTLIADLVTFHGNEIEHIRQAVRIEPYIPIVHDDDELVHHVGKANVIPWGVDNIESPTANAMGYSGQGIVVAIVDSGVSKDHEALKDKMRKDYNWFDAQNHTSTPFDIMGHGTHCTGSILGGKGIGVSPRSKWIACRIFDDGGAQEDVILTCSQWIFCPTLPDGSKEDCTKRPHVCSNSWGGGQNDPFFEDSILAWRAANIIPVFSIGNSGPSCGTANSPGDGDNLISVGACNAKNAITFFSSRGPSKNTFHPRLKPEICAPGYRIISSYIGRTDVNRYASLSGTSMSCPHVAGACAVLLSKKPTATFTEIFNALRYSTIQPEIAQNNYHHQCFFEGVANATTSWPNNIFGYGIIRLTAALDYLK